jgi:hypothetical protein
MAEIGERFQSHMAEAVKMVRMRRLLEIILPFAPNVLTVNCHDQLVRWIAERAGWVVAVDSRLDRLERCSNFDIASQGWEPGNLETFHGSLAEYAGSPEAWDWRVGFDLVISDGTVATAEDPARELLLMRSWAPWILATASGDGGIGREQFVALFEKVIVCEDDGDAVVVLGR